jgi:hypothetical protein
MDLKIFEKLKKEIPGCSITLEDSTKRSDGEWHARWTFNVKGSPSGPILFESNWFGYRTVDEALFEISKSLTEYMQKSQ